MKCFGTTRESAFGGLIYVKKPLYLFTVKVCRLEVYPE
jgi:hypothetical protein